MRTSWILVRKVHKSVFFFFFFFWGGGGFVIVLHQAGEKGVPF